MYLPAQVKQTELQQRVRAVIDIAKMIIGQPGAYMHLPDITEQLEDIDRLLSDEDAELEIIEMHARGAGYLTIRDDGMPFTDTRLAQEICKITGDIHQMYWAQNALSMMRTILAKPDALPVAKEIYDIIVTRVNSFAADGRGDREYLYALNDKLREIRTQYGAALGDEYQKVFQELMG